MVPPEGGGGDCKGGCKWLGCRPPQRQRYAQLGFGSPCRSRYVASLSTLAARRPERWWCSPARVGRQQSNRRKPADAPPRNPPAHKHLAVRVLFADQNICANQVRCQDHPVTPQASPPSTRTHIHFFCAIDSYEAPYWCRSLLGSTAIHTTGCAAPPRHPPTRVLDERPHGQVRPHVTRLPRVRELAVAVVNRHDDGWVNRLDDLRGGETADAGPVRQLAAARTSRGQDTVSTCLQSPQHRWYDRPRCTYPGAMRLLSPHPASLPPHTCIPTPGHTNYLHRRAGPLRSLHPAHRSACFLLTVRASRASPYRDHHAHARLCP